MPHDSATHAKVSTMQPFAAGDLLLGATDLNVPTDDHAGDGRIFQFDKNMKMRPSPTTTPVMDAFSSSIKT